MSAAVDANLPGPMIRKRNEQLADDLVLSAAEGMAEQGRADDALAFLDGAAAEGVAPEHIRQMKRRIRQIDNQARVDFLRDTAGDAAELTHLVQTGQAGAREIDAARDAGLFQDREQLEWALRTSAVNVAKANARRGNSLREAYEDLAAGDADQATTNLIYDHLLESAQDSSGEIMPPADRLALGLQLATKTKYVPAGLVADVKENSRSNNPDALAMAAMAHRQIVAAVPGAPTGATNRSELVAHLFDAGMPADEAAQLVISKTEGVAPPNVGETWTKRTKDVDWNERIAAATGGLLSEDAVATDPRLVSDTMALAEEFFKVTGDPEAAIAYAARTAARGRAPTKVFGADHVQKYAPDAVLSSRIDSSLIKRDEIPQLIENETRSALQAAGVTPATLEHGKDPWEVHNGRPPVRLFTDKRTKDEVMTGQPVTYRVLVRHQNGGYTPIRDKSGQYVRYTLPTQTEALVALGAPERRRRERIKAAEGKEKKKADLERSQGGAAFQFGGAGILDRAN